MAFTPIDADTSWQELSIAQEIATAYDLRADACGAPHIDPEAGTVYDFILAVQTGITAMATQWADPAASYTGSTFPSSFATSAAFMIHCGLTGDGVYAGWRRAITDAGVPADWTVYDDWTTFGPVQDGDLIGPWLFIDIETALSALTRQLRTEVMACMGDQAYSDYVHDPVYPDLVPSYPTLDNPGMICAIVVSRTKDDVGPHEQHVGYAWCPEAEVSGLAATSKTIRLVVYAQYIGGYYDFGLGFTAGEYNLYSSATGHTGTSHMTSVFGNILTWDDVTGYTPWSSVAVLSTVSRIIELSGLNWVIDYDF